jgi:DNA polymerase III sliding clamp (beta) subunit (PCNA family)
MTTTISSPEQIADMSANQEQKTFILPADIMYIAAQFVSQDSFKGILTGISIKPCGPTFYGAMTSIEICSTDGHRMFRCRIPVVEKAFFLDRHIVVNAAAFKKKVAKASFIHLSLSAYNGVEMANFFGSKADLISSVPYTTLDGDYPNYDQLWPDTFTNQPGVPISFNAGYLASFLKEVQAFSSNSNVTMNCNRATTPLTFSATHHLYSDVTLEYLLMPVQIRSQPIPEPVK